MSGIILRSLFFVLFAAALAFACASPLLAQRTSRAKPAAAFKLPKEIVLVITVEDLPGIKNPKSFWEAAYDIRIADWNLLMAKPGLSELPEAGDRLLQSELARRNFLAESDRHLEVAIPVTGSLAGRLKKQASNPQVFLLRSTIRIFDAELDRQYALKLNRLWQFKLFPDGKATIAIIVNSDGSYSTSGPTPKVLPPGYSIIGRPSNPAAVRNP